MKRKIAFFDLETTGLDVMNDHIIQLAIIDSSNPDNRYTTLLNPGVPLQPVITEITGLRDADLVGAPKFAQVANDILAFIADFDGLGGHNASRFDVPLLATEFARCGIDWPTDKLVVVDTYLIEKDRYSHALGPTYKRYFGKDFDDWHNAFSDATASMQIAEAMEQASEEGIYRDLSEDIYGKVIRNKDGELVFGFGKHMNEPVLRNLDYAQWMLRSDFPLSTKRAILKCINEANAQRPTIAPPPMQH